MTNRALTNCTRMTDLPFLRINLRISISRMTLLSCHTHQVQLKNHVNYGFKYFFQVGICAGLFSQVEHIFLDIRDKEVGCRVLLLIVVWSWRESKSSSVRIWIVNGDELTLIVNRCIVYPHQD